MAFEWKIKDHTARVGIKHTQVETNLTKYSKNESPAELSSTRLPPGQTNRC